MSTIMSDALPPSLFNLVQFLQYSQDGVGIIKIPTAIEEAVKRDLSPQSTMPISHVEAVVAALDHGEPSLCSRLDLHAFVIVYLILSRSEDCVAQQRGLALLTESLQDFAMSLSHDTTKGLEKKARLGQKALSFLIQNFGNQRRSRWTRRWMGIFALELLSGCGENKNLLLSKAQDTWRSIGDTILHGSCEILKLVAGLLVGELWPNGPPTDAPWFPERDSANYASFPSYTYHSSQWVVDFESFVDGLDSEGLLSQIRNDVFLAYGVSVEGDLTYGWEDQSAILVTVSTELNIVVCALETSPARYIDILHGQIESVSLEKKQSLTQSSPVVTETLEILVIWLTRSSDKTYYLGAGKRFAPSIKLAFTSLDEASAVMKRLVEAAPHIVEKFTCSESEPLSVSQPLLGSIEEQAMPHETTIQVNSIRSGVVTTATESVSLPAFGHKPEADLTHSFLNWPNNVSVGVQRTIGLNELPSDTGISIEDNQVGGLGPHSHSPTQIPDDVSDGGLRSSAEWRSGAVLIDTAPELQGTYHHVVDEEDISRKSNTPLQTPFPEREDTHNSFYNATPRVKDVTARQAEHIDPHGDRKRGLKKLIEPVVSENLEAEELNENAKPEASPAMVRDNKELPIQLSKDNRLVNGDGIEIRKSMNINNGTDLPKKKPTLTKVYKRKVGKTRTEIGSLKVNGGHSKQEKQGGDEFDFPHSPGKTQTARNAQVPSLKTITGGTTSSPGKRNLAYRLIPNGNSSGRNGASQINGSGGLLGKVPSNVTTIKNTEGEKVNANWDEGLVEVENNGLEINRRRKRPALGKAKPVSKRFRNKENDAYSSNKGLGETKRKRTQKSKPASRPAPQPRSRRTAALVATQRIKKFVGCDTSQEQSHGDFTHGEETSRPDSPQEALSPKNRSNIKPNPYLRRNQQPTLSHSPEPLEADNLNHDRNPENTTASDLKLDLKLQNGDLELITSSKANELEESQTLNSLALREHPAQPRVLSCIKGTPELTVKNGHTGVAHWAGSVAHMSSPETGVPIRIKKENKEREGDGYLRKRNRIFNGPSSPSVNHRETQNLESPTPSCHRLLDSAEGTFPPQRILLHETSGSRRNSQMSVTPRHSVIEITSRDSPRIVHSGADRGALLPRKTYQKAGDVVGPGANEAVQATATSKNGNNFATNLRKALSGIKVLDERHRAPEAQMRIKPGDHAETYVVRPPTKPLNPQINFDGSHQAGYRSQSVEDSKLDPGISTASAVQKPSAKSEQVHIISSPKRLTLSLDQTEKPTNVHISSDAEDESSTEYSENEIQADTRLKGKPDEDFQIHQTPERSTWAAHRNVQLAQQIRTRTPQKKFSAQNLDLRVTPTKPPRDINRKSNLISFTSRGPRNQGIISKLDNRPSSSLNPTPPRLLVADPDKSLKRKLPVWDELISDLEPDLVRRKRLRISATMPKMQDEIPRRAEKRRGSILKGATHRPSSQSTRVDKNGSPLPFVHSRKYPFRDDGGQPLAEINKFPISISSDDEGEFLTFDHIDAEPSRSALEARLPETIRLSRRMSSSNSKRKRSLNDSPSLGTNQLTAHRVHPSGEFINVHTETVVMPIRPPDPFVETKNFRRNTFMEMLRRSGKVSKPLEKNRLGLPGEDPDKTLIDNQSTPNSAETSPSESSSSESTSSSEGRSSSDGEFQEEVTWRQTLEDHQRGQLDALYDIAHRLVAHLANKETAINDLVSDYKRGGTRLIHEFQKSRQQDIDVFQSSTNELKQKVGTLIKKETARLKSSMDQIKRMQVAGLEKEWEDQQRTMWAKMDAALAVSAS